MKKKFMAIGLLALAALGVTSCGSSNDTTSDDTNQSQTTVSAQALKNAKADLKATFDDAVNDLGIDASNHADYFNEIKQIYEKGINAFDDASDDTRLTNYLTNYKKQINDKKSEIQAKLNNEKLQKAKNDKINLLKKYGLDKVKAAGYENPTDFDKDYETKYLNPAIAIINNSSDSSKLDNALKSAKLKFDELIDPALSNTDKIDLARKTAADQILDYYYTEMNKTTKVDDGTVYADITKAITELSSVADQTKINKIVTDTKATISTKLQALNSSLDAIKGEGENIVFANSFMKENSTVPCVMDLEKNNYQFYGRQYYFDEASNKGDKHYENSYINEPNNKANITISENGLVMDDNSADGEKNWSWIRGNY